ncbi:hypothetical protein CNYM01_04159 [Colletotrichum nymphaeae SA-01]|uniref:Uncharacterized protein n=1 Tax=Colletotrichum nymphaeae SA-01 TaxID=1460502 RepID=A0A135S395_9PEZI|nr:hypothetical protein CNYM01_04159 [Colletotrichum nymphaeae SA-01]
MYAQLVRQQQQSVVTQPGGSFEAPNTTRWGILRMKQGNPVPVLQIDFASKYLLSLTLLAASTVHLAFRAKSLGEIREWMYGTHYKYKSGIFRQVPGNSQYYGGGQTMRYDPRKMLPLYYELHLANAVIGLFTSITVSFIAVRAFSRGPVPMVQWARSSLFLVLIISVILALMSMAFTLAGLGQSSHFDLDYANSLPFPDGILYDKGRFAAQTWACGVMDIPKFDEEGWLHSVSSGIFAERGLIQKPLEASKLTL